MKRRLKTKFEKFLQPLVSGPQHKTFFILLFFFPMPPKGRYVLKNTGGPAKTSEHIKKPPSRYENFPAGLIPAEEWLRFRITIVTLLVHRSLNAEFNTCYSRLVEVIDHIREANALPAPIINLLLGLNKMNNATKHDSEPLYGTTFRPNLNFENFCLSPTNHPFIFSRCTGRTTTRNLASHRITVAQAQCASRW